MDHLAEAARDEVDVLPSPVQRRDQLLDAPGQHERVRCEHVLQLLLGRNARRRECKGFGTFLLLQVPAALMCTSVAYDRRPASPSMSEKICTRVQDRMTSAPEHLF